MPRRSGVEAQADTQPGREPFSGLLNGWNTYKVCPT